MANGNDQVHVSLATLRAEIRAANSELELSLRKFVSDEMEEKAPMTVVAAINVQIADLLRGELNPPQRRAIKEIVKEMQDGSNEQRWTARERMLGGIAMALWFITTLLTLLGIIFK